MTTEIDLPHFRLLNTGLASSPFQSPDEVVTHLGAVQAQDFAAAKWSVGLRMRKATDAIVEKAFNEGKFLRTHVMRPTWHFIMPEDIRWMLELTSPRVKKILIPYDRQLGITDEVVAKSQKLIAEALKGKNFLNRAELAMYLKNNGISALGQKLAHLLYYSEQNALICSGPRRGKQFTYGLLEEIVPKAKNLNKQAALAKLALKYFMSHGPAQVGDFAWWSGLPAKDANEGLGLVKSKLTYTTVNGKTYWFLSNIEARSHHLSNSRADPDKQAFLLSVYDEYSIAYKDRSDISEKRDIERMLAMGNALTAVIILDGKVAGTWKRVLNKDTVEIKLNPFKKLTEIEQNSVKKAAKRYGDYLEKKIIM
jgi:Winged helix DNA-binding domain